MDRNVIAVVDDLFFASKIRATAESLTIQLRFARTNEQLSETVGAGRTDLIIVDLHSRNVDPIALAHDLKSRPDLAAVPLLGFFSHVDTEVHRKAVEAGYDNVIPRSLFSRELAGILKGELC